MSFFAALKSLLPSRKPKRSRLLAPLVDPRFDHPAYKTIPEELRRVLGDPTYLRNPPYHDGYYGLISGEYCMRTFQTKLMDKLEIQSGLSPEEFENYLEPILIAYAELVHLLPASEHHHHNTPGGLLRHGLETACFMLDWMVMTKFDHELTPGDASKRLRRWYVAGIIAALFHDAGKPLTDVRVMNFEGNLKWNMGPETIHEWAVANNVTRYFLSWVKDRDESHKSETTRLIGKYVNSAIERWIIDGGEDIWKAMIAATSDLPGPLTAAVKLADSRSVKADRERTGTTDGEATTGVPIQRICVDAMRGLLDEGTWTVNQQGARLWKTTEGVFLAWGTGSADIISQVVKDKVGGFPRGEFSLQVAMMERELIVKNDDGSAIFYVAPHILRKNDKGPSLRCVKLKNPDGVFPSVMGMIPPISATIGRDGEAKDFLTEEDARIKASLDKAEAGNGQADLFHQGSSAATAQPTAKQASKPKPAEADAPRTGVTLPPALAAKAAELKGQPVQPAEQEIDKDDSIDLAALDDDALSSMLMDLSAVTVPSTPAEPSTHAAENGPSLEDCAPHEDSAQGPSAAPVMAQKGYKLTLADLMPSLDDMKLKPVEVFKDQPNKAQGQPKKPKPMINVPEQFRSKLSKPDFALLKRNPELADKLLAEFAQKKVTRQIKNKVFVALEGSLAESDLEAIESAGWLWLDFTSPEEVRVREVRGVKGFLANKQLSDLLCRLLDSNWHPWYPGSLQPEDLAEYTRIADAFYKAAMEESAMGLGVRSMAFWQRDKTLESLGADIETAEAALFYCYDTVKNSRDKKYFLKPQGKE